MIELPRVSSTFSSPPRKEKVLATGAAMIPEGSIGGVIGATGCFTTLSHLCDLEGIAFLGKAVIWRIR
jgi:proteasome assembly chaperone (PAC2) family protein